MQERKNMTDAARDLRISVLETAYHGGDANLQSVFSSIEILRVLYDRVLKYRRKQWIHPSAIILS